MLTLQLAPRSQQAEEAVRRSGSTPKTIMRLMNNELVAKLYEYLVGKWKLVDVELVLFHKGTKMLLTDLLSYYQESEVSLRVSLEYDVVNDESVTASSTPTGASAPQPDFVHPEPTVISNNFAAPPESCPSACEAQPTVVSVERHVVEPTVESSQRVAEGHMVSHCLTTSTCASEPVGDPTTKSDRKKKKPEKKRKLTHSVETCTDPIVQVTPPGAESVPNVESMLREMLDRQEKLVMTVLDSQARWFAEMQSNMLNLFRSR